MQNNTFFRTTDLAGNRVLIEGTDQRGTYGQQVIDAQEWVEIRARLNHADAHEVFDEAVKDFFAPLVKAVDALQEDHKPKIDPLSVIVLQEGEASTEGQPEIAIALSYESMILRLLEQDPQTSRLIWVNDILEILPEPTAPAIVESAVNEGSGSRYGIGGL